MDVRWRQLHWPAYPDIWTSWTSTQKQTKNSRQQCSLQYKSIVVHCVSVGWCISTVFHRLLLMLISHLFDKITKDFLNFRQVKQALGKPKFYRVYVKGQKKKRSSIQFKTEWPWDKIKTFYFLNSSLLIQHRHNVSTFRACRAYLFGKTGVFLGFGLVGLGTCRS